MIWTRNNLQSIVGDQFTLEEGYLIIQNISSADSGQYECILNQLGVVGQRNIQVQVLPAVCRI